ncbi:unannotated protein [freshwater metagenome]|uniref:Unannotated protein n=1 Tax=freshwater metagenome TaxID=449393 RepID=A0A6J6EEI2_9ZZZZ
MGDLLGVSIGFHPEEALCDDLKGKSHHLVCKIDLPLPLLRVVVDDPMHEGDIGIKISVVKGRLHHPAMLHMDRFLVGEKPFAEDFPHPGESDTFDEVMLLGDCDLVRSLRREDSDEESTSEEEGGDISMTLLHSLQELRCIDHEGEGE